MLEILYRFPIWDQTDTPSRGSKKIKILEKYRYFLVAIATDPTPSGVHVRECYTYADLTTVMYVRPCIAVLR